MRSLFLRRFCAALAVSSSLSAAICSADEVAFDDFESLTLVDFDVANIPKGDVGDKTDYLRDIPGWTRDDSGMPYQVEDLPADHSGELAFEGGNAMDVESWISEQGNQAGRADGVGALSYPDVRNTALVFDPDAWDDFNGAASSDYNSYLISPAVTVTGLASVTVELDYQFVTEVTQRGTVEVSFDDGATWSVMLLDLDSANFDNGTNLSGVDAQFPVAVPGSATEMKIRIGCTLAGNNWWYAVDNIEVLDGTTSLWFEDFEGLTLLPFGTEEGQANEIPPVPGDGTDYTNMIGEWVVSNVGTTDFPTKILYNASVEGAFNGFAAVDAWSWINQQGGTNGAGGQDRDTLLGSGTAGGFPDHNTILLADPDAHNDFPEETQNDPPEGEKEFNSFVSRQYDLSLFQNTSVVVEFDWECRIESNQRALAQVSFDYGQTWTTVLDIDSDDQAKIDALAPYSFGALDLYGSYAAATQFAFGVPTDGTKIPAVNSNAMILRFGCIDSDNNWWFAVDNVRITADPQAYAMGDASGDGIVNNLDIGGFILALTDKASFDAGAAVPADQLFDFNVDGVFNNLDIGGFLTELNN